MIFVAMVALVKVAVGSDASGSNASSATNSKKKNRRGGSKRKHRQQQYDDLVFQVEAHHIVGSLLTISALWIFVDVVQSLVVSDAKKDGESSPSAFGFAFLSHPLLPVLWIFLGLAWYALFLRCILRKPKQQQSTSTELVVKSEDAHPEDVDSGMMSTYALIASTLGLISGLCSQFLLSFLLWNDNMTQPLVGSVVGFSVLWSLCTVVLTFVGCISLRLLTVDESSPLQAERIFLRMESFYIFHSLVGICGAWILIDLVLNMKSQILPSLLMMALSLVAFAAIVKCFPEEKCLEDLKEQEQRRKDSAAEEGAVANVGNKNGKKNGTEMEGQKLLIKLQIV